MHETVLNLEGTRQASLLIACEEAFQWPMLDAVVGHHSQTSGYSDSIVGT